jgi:hypothetical protein
MLTEEGLFGKRTIPTDFLYDGLFDTYPMKYWEDKMGISVEDGGVDQIMDEMEYEMVNREDKKFMRRSHTDAIAYAEENFPEYVAYVKAEMLKDPSLKQYF